jgi:hypothetical protein
MGIDAGEINYSNIQHTEYTGFKPVFMSPCSSSMVRFEMVALTSRAVKNNSRSQERSITKAENMVNG